LLTKLKEITLPPHFGWIESLQITSPQPLALEDINDDPAREQAFYKVTLHGVKQGLIQLEQGKMPFQRPVDYYAEMVKPDEHMAKIKDSLLREKKRMDLVQDRKRQRQFKKVSKQVQAEKQRERSKAKKDTLEKISDLRKKHKGKMDLQKEDIDLALDEKRAAPEDAETKKGEKRKGGMQKKGKSKRRKIKDKKFGFGGPKKDKKKNTAGSSGSLKSFSLGKNKKLWTGFKADKKSGTGGQVGSKKKKKAARPGKTQRQQSRSQK